MTRVSAELVGGEAVGSADFRVNLDRSGIKLRSFTFNTALHTVTGVLGYEKWNFGRHIPGAGQIGVYRISSLESLSRYAVVKDYEGSAKNEDWKLALLSLAENQFEIMEDFATDRTHGREVLKILEKLS